MPRLVKDASKKAHQYLKRLYEDKCIEEYVAELYVNAGKTPPRNAFHRYYEDALYALTKVFGFEAMQQMEKAIAKEVEPNRHYCQSIAELMFYRYKERQCSESADELVTT